MNGSIFISQLQGSGTAAGTAGVYRSVCAEGTWLASMTASSFSTALCPSLPSLN